MPNAAAFSAIFPTTEISVCVGLKQAPELPCRVVDEVEVIETFGGCFPSAAHGCYEVLQIPQVTAIQKEYSCAVKNF